MGEVYWGAYRVDHERGLIPCSLPAVGDAASVKAPFEGPFCGIGRGFAAYPALQALPGIMLPVGACEALPDARDVARLGAIRLAAGDGLDPADLAPIYLRDKVALTELERQALRRTKS
jgi:tRNA threonylcarbamoyladenosine biosynthesis protein TsaB